MDFTTIFLSLTALVAFVVLVTDLIVRIFKTEKKLFKQITAWVLSIVLSLIGFWLKQGMFNELTIWATILTGLGAGVAANGLYTIDKVQFALDFLLKFLPKKK
jgi:hypothetical protein